MWTAQFWRDAAERSVKSFAQTLAAAFTASGAGLLDAPWWASLSTAGMVAVLSLLTSAGSTARGDPETASLSRNVAALPYRVKMAEVQSRVDHPAGRAGDPDPDPHGNDRLE